MRLFPTWVHPLLAKTLPSIWKGHSYIRQTQKLLVPEILRRRELMASEKLEKGTKDTLLSWMMECADGSESDPNRLAHLEIVISLAAIHKSQMNAVQVLYDLAGPRNRPRGQWLAKDVLRQAAQVGQLHEGEYAVQSP